MLDELYEELDARGMTTVMKLEMLQEAMLELLGVARGILGGMEGNAMAYARADAYWLAHVEMALKKETKYLGGSMVTMADTIEELRRAEEGDGEENAEEEGK